MTGDVLFQNAIGILEIIWLNVVLSGDNAVVIALACRGLPERSRRRGMMIGAGVAVGLRVVFTLLVVALLGTPFLRIAGGLLLVWIAIKLLVEEDDEEDEVAESGRLWKAVWTIAVADMVMSLDNVLAIAAVAKDNTALLVLGLLISIPLIIAGASLIMALLERLPILTWAGAVLLGWVAGEMLISDPFLERRYGAGEIAHLHYPAAGACAALVLAIGSTILWRRRARKAARPRA